LEFKQLAAMSMLFLGLCCPAQERSNFFDDPFVQVTKAMPGCPVPEGPLVTQAEVREQAHVRAQHGGSCYRAGRCRLPNSYLYDKEIIPRVAVYIQQDGRFDATSVWVLGERRLVTLMGCVQSAQQAQALEQAVGLVDDVIGVINHLMVGTQGNPPYKPAGTAAK
jgi:osmotically-inducible protein OsmY